MSETRWQGRFLTVEQDGDWEWAARRNAIRAAVIVAIDRDAVILVEQYRIPIGRRSLELPAGLVGDDCAGESVVVAAARELEEETGYRAGRLVEQGSFFSSPGMTSEEFVVVRATDLVQVGPGGGAAGEDITVLRVPLPEVASLVRERRAAGDGIDAKLLLLLGAGMLEAGDV